MWKRKRSVDQLHGKDLLDRAHKLGIRFTNISEECIKSQIREAEKVLRERRRERWHETIELVLYAVVGLAAGVTIMTVIAKVLVGSSPSLFQPDIIPANSALRIHRQNLSSSS